jgi:hypothetical protein
VVTIIVLETVMLKDDTIARSVAYSGDELFQHLAAGR